MPQTGRDVRSQTLLSDIIICRSTHIPVGHAYHVKLHTGPVTRIARVKHMACTQGWDDTNTHGTTRTQGRPFQPNPVSNRNYLRLIPSRVFMVNGAHVFCGRGSQPTRLVVRFTTSTAHHNHAAHSMETTRRTLACTGLTTSDSEYADGIETRLAR